MAENETNIVGQIGATAGLVWKALADNGPMSLTSLLKAVSEPRDSVMLAIGWLAREDKIDIVEQRRTRTISLR
jgi:hypothetical protein